MKTNVQSYRGSKCRNTVVYSFIHLFIEQMNVMGSIPDNGDSVKNEKKKSKTSYYQRATVKIRDNT